MNYEICKKCRRPRYVDNTGQCRECTNQYSLRFYGLKDPMNGENKMENKQGKPLADEAKETELRSFKNVTDMEEIKVDVTIYDGEDETKEGKPFSYKYIKDGESEVRIPKTVLAQLKAHLEENPKLEKFKVVKNGEGINTSYTVIPK